MATGDAVGSEQDVGRPPPDSAEQVGDSADRQDYSSVRGEVSFPTSMRGYDRGAVDAYVDRVKHAVTELEMTRSPEAAVRHALAEVGEQTKGILEHAGETAEQITVAARREAEESHARATSEAEDIVAKAKAEATEMLARSNAEAESTRAQAQKDAAEHLQRSRDEVTALREEAEARLRELQTDTENVRQERGQLLDDIRAFARQVEEVASAADARFPPDTAERDEGELDAETTDLAPAEPPK